MESWGLVVAVLGALVLAVAELRMARANTGERIPAWRGARVRPARAIALRALGAGLAVLGVTLAATDTGSVLILSIVVWLPMLVLHAVHNRRVAASGRPEQP